ncbi:FAD/NAD(P)-binding oxidoreductase [Aliiglaciecola sp. 3_MG-2023]|uniref:NAD(P)/FAD-dependent oxidoreductase n=1 Tax=Aliiglaciecola sp. 3_MG-2023 TaxID=3062644 RepID=UPI0026E23B62|nr:FAD/NAD(P)-binding oxidoreductase [Aliiglaciecola sp. 3_MG-2023]MDO6694506.1 FAD/NAD(P)-binding oxidoreductase [Aliiglaciecola sp. 3_MG-2023]
MSCIIIGASHAGVNAAINLRNLGYQGKITLISADKVLPYQRPPLSKAFLQNTLPEQRLWLRPEAFYQQKEIDLMLGKRVISIDREQQTVELDDGQCLTYDKLILATGASIRRLSIPGSDLIGVHYMRDCEDTMGLRDALPDAKNVVVVGGGYIGLEVAASLQKLGKNVTLLLNQERPLKHLTSAVVSDYLSELHKANGVNIQPNAAAQAIIGDEKVTAVEASNGECYPADIVVAGIGVNPEQALAQQCGLAIDNGIQVNQYMQSSDENIYAIGDCVSFFHPIYNQQMRIESVQNATDQAKTAALAICDKLTPYTATPWFWSDQYDAKLQIAGLSNGYDEFVVRKESENSLAVFYFSKQRLIAIDAINQPKSFMITRKYLHQLPAVDKNKLADNDQDLNTLFTELVGV